MGFGKAFAAGKRYEDNHATLERGKRSRVVPVERGNTFDSERGFWKLTAVTKQQFGVAHSLVTKKRWWRRRASTGAALRCLLAHAKRIPALAKLGDAALVHLEVAQAQARAAKTAASCSSCSAPRGGRDAGRPHALTGRSLARSDGDVN